MTKRRPEIYELLWKGSAAKPYSDLRESEIIHTRFARVKRELNQMAASCQTSGGRLRVLDFGCADGHTAQQILASAGDRIEYCGCDLYDVSEAVSVVAKPPRVGIARNGGLPALQETDTEFDAIFALSCLQYVDDPQAVVNDLAQRLRYKGALFVYLYDARPLRRATDNFFRSAFADKEVEDLLPLARFWIALRDALGDTMVEVPEDVPELGLTAGPARIQRLIVESMLFAWAPPDSSTQRVAWALGEMFLTGSHTYFDRDAASRLVGVAELDLEWLESGSSGHLLKAVRSQA